MALTLPAVPPSYSLPVPLFESGGVRFYQSPSLSQHPPRHSDFFHRGLAGGHFDSNEIFFPTFCDIAAGSGGAVVGIGSLQNLSLACAAGASGLVFVDRHPLVAMTLMLLLPSLPEFSSPEEFRRFGLRLPDDRVDMTPYLTPIPVAYRTAFMRHIEDIRSIPLYHSQVEGPFLSHGPCKPDFLEDEDSFAHAAHLIRQGGISVFHGDFFDEQTPDFLSSALDGFSEGIRTLYLSNALSAYVSEDHVAPLAFLQDFLRSPDVNPDGHLFLTSLDIGRFFYHALPFKEFEDVARRTQDVGTFLHEMENRQLMRKRPMNRYRKGNGPLSAR